MGLTKQSTNSSDQTLKFHGESAGPLLSILNRKMDSPVRIASIVTYKSRIAYRFSREVCEPKVSFIVFGYLEKDSSLPREEDGVIEIRVGYPHGFHGV